MVSLKSMTHLRVSVDLPVFGIMAARQFVANKFPAKPLQKLTQVHLFKAVFTRDGACRVPWSAFAFRQPGQSKGGHGAGQCNEANRKFNSSWGPREEATHYRRSRRFARGNRVWRAEDLLRALCWRMATPRKCFDRFSSSSANRVWKDLLSCRTTFGWNNWNTMQRIQSSKAAVEETTAEFLQQTMFLPLWEWSIFVREHSAETSCRLSRVTPPTLWFVRPNLQIFGC